MEVSQEPFPDLRARLATLGCKRPTTLSLLPLNLDTASTVADLVFPTSAATVHTLLRQAGLSYDDILPGDVSKQHKLDRSDDLILPALFVAATWFYENRAVLKTALDMLVAYLQRYMMRSDQTQVCFDIVHESSDGDFTKTSYKGPLEGLPTVLDAVDNRLLQAGDRDDE